MNDLVGHRRSAQVEPIEELASDAAIEDHIEAVGDDIDAATVLRMSREMDAPRPSASESAYGAQPKAKKRKPTSSHDGGFIGFGAEFHPFSYDDPKMDHHKLDPKVERLGAQYVRVFVPLNVVSSGLLGQAGTDYDKANVEHLTTAVANNPTDAALAQRLAKAKQQYAQDVRYVNSFIKTLALAGKDTTINLTFSGSVGHDARIDQLAAVVAYLTHSGYHKLQVTLENEPNGPDTGDGFRGRFNKAVAGHDKAGANAAAKEYVDAYARLDDQLEMQQVRDDVSIIGGDMVGNNRGEFFETITREGLNQHVDGYSFHVYWGAAGRTFPKQIAELDKIHAQAQKWAKGKPIMITELGKKKDAPGGPVADEPGVTPAFQQGLFSLHAINSGFIGAVKWDAFALGNHHKGDGKGEPGTFYMIGGAKTGYKTDESYRLERMFTHAVEPGWHCHGTNHGDQGAEAYFRSEDGKDGAILAMSHNGKSIATGSLPKHRKLYVTTWNRNGKGDLHTHLVDTHTRPAVAIPANGAVAISTKPFYAG